MESDLVEWITEAGGELVGKNYPTVIDYFVVPVPVNSLPSNIKAKEFVTYLWVEGSNLLSVRIIFVFLIYISCFRVFLFYYS